jgi:RNA polymerase sigma factor (sigma-70 family)
MNPTDSELLQCFINQKDQDAFEELVRRFGPVVMGACQRILRNPHDTQDVFQATFLALAQKGHTIRKTQSVGGWLYGVAVRSACTLIEKREAQHRKETQWSTETMNDSTDDETRWEKLATILDEELKEVPEKYRDPILLPNRASCETDART